jgi:hypothetical protein
LRAKKIQKEKLKKSYHAKAQRGPRFPPFEIFVLFSLIPDLALELEGQWPTAVVPPPPRVPKWFPLPVLNDFRFTNLFPVL